MKDLYILIAISNLSKEHLDRIAEAISANFVSINEGPGIYFLRANMEKPSEVWLKIYDSLNSDIPFFIIKSDFWYGNTSAKVNAWIKNQYPNTKLLGDVRKKSEQSDKPE